MPTETVNPTETIDHDRLQALKEDIGEEIFAAILTEFYHETETAIADLSDAVKANDRTRTRELLHLITGSASNIGATNLVQLCASARAELEAGTAPADLDPEAFKAALTAFKAAL